MNKTLMSFLKTSALAITLYACTEDAERLQQSDDDMNLAAAAASMTTTTELSKRKFTPDVGGAIALADAQRWIRKYRKEHPNEIRSRFFGSKAFEAILNNPEVVGISITYATDDDGLPVLLLIGVNGEGKQVLQSTKDSVTGEVSYFVTDRSYPCPPCLPEDDEE